MSYADLVVCVGEGTTSGAGALVVANNLINAGDIAVANLAAAGATVIKIICVTAAGQATFTVADAAGAAVAVAVAINYVILRPSSAGLGNGF